MRIPFKKTAFFIFILSACLFLPQSEAGQDNTFGDPGIPISMDFQDANLKDVLKVLSIQSGTNFVASEAIQDRKITLYLDKVPVKEAMDKLFRANNLMYSMDKEANIFIVDDLGKPEVNRITKVFQLKYLQVPYSVLEIEKSKMRKSLTYASYNNETAESDEGDDEVDEDAPSIVNTIKELLSEYGSVTQDPRSNSIIITDIPNRFESIEHVIAELDVPQPQVMLEVEMLDVSKSLTDKIGFDFTYASNFTMQVVSASRATTWPLNLAGEVNGIAANITAGGLSFNTLRAVMDFLKTDTSTKYLARPRILALNHETAEVKIQTNEVIGLRTDYSEAGGGSVTSQIPDRGNTGVVLRVTPSINVDTGEITMCIYPSEKVSTLSTYSTSTNYMKDIEERSAKTTVTVKDGDTVILGGLIRNQFNEKETKVPILGDLPIVGMAFRHRYKDRDVERELMVFITPRIVQQTGLNLAKAEKIKLLEREQSSAATVADRETVMNTALSDYGKK